MRVVGMQKKTWTDRAAAYEAINCIDLDERVRAIGQELVENIARGKDDPQWIRPRDLIECVRPFTSNN